MNERAEGIRRVATHLRMRLAELRSEAWNYLGDKELDRQMDDAVSRIDGHVRKAEMAMRNGTPEEAGSRPRETP